MNSDNNTYSKQSSAENHPLSIALPQYEFSLNGIPLSWDTEAGKMKVFGIDASIFWLDPSLALMLAPIVEEVGIDLFRLLVASSSSMGTQQDYDTIMSDSESFSEGFASWSASSAVTGWGKFRLLEYSDNHAMVQIDNAWELAIQKDLPADKRWGCPFILGKMIGLFKHAFSKNCWATDHYEFTASGDSRAILKIYPSDKSIDSELKKLRKDNSTHYEQKLELEIEQKTAELKKSNSLLENIANLDFLTNLNNRRALEQTLSMIKSDDTWGNHTLMFVDLDQFKVINDTCGHLAGDKLLTLIGERLISCIGHDHFISRYGGDEFAILLKLTDMNIATDLASKIHQTISTTQFEWDEKVYNINCSIGLTPLKTIPPEVDSALIAADNACYQAKKNGRNQIFISEHLNEAVESRLSEMNWVHRIRDAIKANQFELHFQLIKPTLDNNTQFSLEALIRMVDSDGSLIMPNNFLPAAENYDVIFDIDCWVIENIFKKLKLLGDNADILESVAINLSGGTLSNPNLESVISRCFREYKIQPEKICFEITETHMMMNVDAAINILSKLRKHGCTVSLDDFGAGMSSFGYLKKLPIDKIKIDGDFVKNMDESMVDYTFVESITNVARAMKIKTVAEFVENERIVELLEDINVDYLQGHYIGKPQIWNAFF